MKLLMTCLMMSASLTCSKPELLDKMPNECHDAVMKLYPGKNIKTQTYAFLYTMRDEIILLQARLEHLESLMVRLHHKLDTIEEVLIEALESYSQ